MTNNIQTLVTACRMLGNLGICNPFGHISARVPGKDLFIIPGHLNHYGRSLSEATSDDIVTLDMNGKKVAGKIEPVEEAAIHYSIYRSRPEINSVCYGHSLVLEAFGLARKSLAQLRTGATVGWIIAKGIPNVSIEQPDGRIKNIQDAKPLVKALKNSDACLFSIKAGSVTVGKSIEESCVDHILLEQSAKMQMMVEQLGTVAKIPTAYKEGPGIKAPTGRNMWAYYSKRYGGLK